MSDTGGLNFIDFLAYGAIGIALALAILSYRLLSKEQQREEVREPMLKSIRNYFIMSIVLSLFFGTGEIISNMMSKEQVTENTLEDFWEDYLSKHPEEKNIEITDKGKRNKITSALRSQATSNYSSNDSKIIKELRDSLERHKNMEERLASSFYVKIEKFIQTFNDVASSRNWLYLKAKQTQKEVGLYKQMMHILEELGIEIEEFSVKSVIREWERIKPTWVKQNESKGRPDHLERSDFGFLVRKYLEMHS